MTEDIKILRDALARYREFVEVPAGDPLDVPLYLYKSAKEIYAEACDPERIRRILDDAERWQAFRNAGGSVQAYVYDDEEDPASGGWRMRPTPMEMDLWADELRKKS